MLIWNKNLTLYRDSTILAVLSWRLDTKTSVNVAAQKYFLFRLNTLAYYLDYGLFIILVRVTICSLDQKSRHVRISNSLDFEWIIQPRLYVNINKILFLYRSRLNPPFFWFFEWSRLFEIQLQTDHLKSDLQKVQIMKSDHSKSRYI